MNLNVHNSLEQRFAMNPELSQSLHILQLSSYELSKYLQEQSAENPLLEVSFEGRAKKYRFGETYIGNLKAKEETLQDNLAAQLRMVSPDPSTLRIAAYLIGNLNDDGYLNMAISEVSAQIRQPQHAVEAALRLVQSFEPAGVGARNLEECLLLQIKSHPQAPPYSAEIADQYLMPLSSGKWDPICTGLGITKEEAMVAAKYIRSLNPRPDLGFKRNESQWVVPDAYIVKEKGFSLKASLLSCPKVSVNESYLHLTGPGAKETDELSGYLKEKLVQANWLIRCVEQRKITLLKVIEAIMQAQSEFLEYGPKRLSPLKMKTIADRLDLHESTISRTIQNKYVGTPSGTFELKSFFVSGLETADGRIQSVSQVKERIKKLIGGELKKMPYSDQKLAELLEQEGIKISRRTVAKYREELQILSSQVRISIGSKTSVT